MSGYTPTTEEVRRAVFLSASNPLTGSEFDRWLAAHDAEVRAGVVAEEPEWEPSDAAAEIVARALFARTKEGRDRWTWPIDQWRRERDMDAARAVLKRAHAAGVPVKQEGTEQ